MKSPQVVRAKLAARTEADCSDQCIKNNKVHYVLLFESNIGWKWLQNEVAEASTDTDIDLELYKIRTSGVNNFEVEVRELVRREDVRDEDQKALERYED
jgi:hypothetical protein